MIFKIIKKHGFSIIHIWSIDVTYQKSKKSMQARMFAAFCVHSSIFEKQYCTNRFKLCHQLLDNRQVSSGKNEVKN
jgi:hypothetical protein